MTDFDLDSTIESLSNSISHLSMRAKAALFGVCGEVLSPLLDEVERRTSSKWTFPDARSALDAVASFATGRAEQSDHQELRQRLFASGPHGHELDSPWSTYAQDAITCIDAALVASSTSGDQDFRPMWIQFALEPLVASLDARGYDVEYSPVSIGGNPLQMELDLAVDFLRSAISKLSGSTAITTLDYSQLTREAQVIVPIVS